MKVPTIVPDASVLLKWVLESDYEEDRDRALEIREAWLSGKCTMILPSLWLFEVGNVLGFKERALAEHLIKTLTDSRFDELTPARFYVKALELMRKFKVTFYSEKHTSISSVMMMIIIIFDLVMISGRECILLSISSLHPTRLF